MSKCIRMLSDQRIDFTLIEPNPALVPCPVVNLVLCAHRQLADITIGYDNLVARQCVRRVCGRAASVEPTRKQVKLEDGSTLRYGKLLLAHGVDMTGDGVEGLQAAQAEGRTPAPLEGRCRNPGAAAAVSGHARGRYRCQRDPEGALPLPARAVRMCQCQPGCGLFLKREKRCPKVLILDRKPNVATYRRRRTFAPSAARVVHPTGAPISTRSLQSMRRGWTRNVWTDRLS